MGEVVTLWVPQPILASTRVIKRRSMMDSDPLRIARDKLTRVFRYLEALNQHRNPAKRQIHEQPWSLWLHGLPNHAAIKRGAAKTTSSKSKARENQAGENEGGGEFLLKVQRPALTRPPEPPEEIANWLEAGWDNPSEEIEVRETLSESQEAAGPRVERFDEDKMRVAGLQRWKSSRDEWARSEKPARAAMKVFETLYALYGESSAKRNAWSWCWETGFLAGGVPRGTSITRFCCKDCNCSSMRRCRNSRFPKRITRLNCIRRCFKP